MGRILGSQGHWVQDPSRPAVHRWGGGGGGRDDSMQCGLNKPLQMEPEHQARVLEPPKPLLDQDLSLTSISSASS